MLIQGCPGLRALPYLHFAYSRCSAHNSLFQKECPSPSNCLFFGGPGLVRLSPKILLACLLSMVCIYPRLPYPPVSTRNIFLFVSPYLLQILLGTLFPVPPFVQVYNSPITTLLLHIISVFLLRFLYLLLTLLVVL